MRHKVIIPERAEVDVWMARNGLTQEDFAKLLGVNRPYLTLVLNGKRKATKLRKRIKAAITQGAALGDRASRRRPRVGLPQF